tara:strand:+ start:707 stop:2458 length:1752 start_codon:yes stop_codon:yes gene_type:complete
MSILQKLTEGVVTRDVSKEGAALLEKWQATGLLEGLNDERQSQGMAVLLENQAKELLREASSMAAGDVEGFAAVAFPIVRRVFGGLIANDLVSVQPMSLPSGLIFFLDFTRTHARGQAAGESVYGGRQIARGIVDGVDLDTNITSEGPGGFYDLANAYSSPTGSSVAGVTFTALVTPKKLSQLTEDDKKNLLFDPDLLDYLADNPTHLVEAVTVAKSDIDSLMPGLNKNAVKAISESTAEASDIHGNARLVRRLTRIDSAGKLVLTALSDTNDPTFNDSNSVDGGLEYPLGDSFAAAGTHAVGGVKGQAPWGMELADDATDLVAGKDLIPEIDIQVDSVSVTAVTKKLKAKWSPELGQDLNAYHNLDAEVELTGILSEHIALEIDQEILGDLIAGAKSRKYWSRAPGLFVDQNGKELGATAAAPDFTGTVSEWYETLVETINDVSAQIHRKTLRGGANFVVCSPEVASILEFTAGFRASVTVDGDKGSIGAQNVGSLSKKFEVHVDPYFPRNVILVGRKGSSFLESGYVYAPYVPLQVTPTIFGTEDFVPRKGVMTRYAKKMVRPDMYGLVIVRGLTGEGGAS